MLAGQSIVLFNKVSDLSLYGLYTCRHFSSRLSYFSLRVAKQRWTVYWFSLQVISMASFYWMRTDVHDVETELQTEKCPGFPWEISLTMFPDRIKRYLILDVVLSCCEATSVNAWNKIIPLYRCMWQASSIGHTLQTGFFWVFFFFWGLNHYRS